MAKPATLITPTDGDRGTLNGWLRARIVFAAADGEGTQEIAAALGKRPASVSTSRSCAGSEGAETERGKTT